MNNKRLNHDFQNLEIDYLYHLGLDSSMDLQQQFGDVKYVVFTRSFSNADYFAAQLLQHHFHLHPLQLCCKPIAKDERYHMHKVANTLIISHGVGFPSMLICLNEIVKLLWHAGATEVEFIRFSTASGVNVNPGTLVVANAAVAPNLVSEWRNIEFGEYYSYPAEVDAKLSQKILALNHKSTLIQGKIMSSPSFYNGQGRLNGALATSYTQSERDAYFQRLSAARVKAIDLESNCFFAFCHQFQIPAVVIAAVIDNCCDNNDNEPGLTTTNDNLVPVLIEAGNVIINYITAQHPRSLA